MYHVVLLARPHEARMHVEVLAVFVVHTALELMRIDEVRLPILEGGFDLLFPIV